MSCHEFCGPGERGRREHGQIAVLAAFVLGLMVAVVITVGLIGAAMIDRTAATAAADAVALADVVDPAAGSSLAGWYNARGYDMQVNAGHARASGDPAQAQSQAIAVRELAVAPVVRAIVARAEQLVGRSLTVVAAQDFTVTFSAESAQHFRAVAAELHMCSGGGDSFVKC